MGERVRFGILGNANIARKALIPAIQTAKNAEVTAIASRSGKAKEAANEMGLHKNYNSYQALLDDPDIDAVYIPLPNHLHAEWTIKTAKAGKHVLCEKPAALTANQVQQMVVACREYGVVFMEAFMYQFHPQHDFVKQLISRGEIGKIKLMYSKFSFYLAQPGGNIRVDKKKGGGCLYDVGSYCIHAARNILGGEPFQVYAQANIDEDTNVDMTTAGVLTMKNGVQALFDSSFEMPLRESYEIVGDKGTIEVKEAFRPDKNTDGAGTVLLKRADGTEEEFQLKGDQYTTQVEHFSQCVMEGHDPLYPGEESVKNMKVIDACYESIETGEAVKLP